MTPPADITQYALRLPRQLADDAKAKAKAEGLSLNKLIVRAVEREVGASDFPPQTVEVRRVERESVPSPTAVTVDTGLHRCPIHGCTFAATSPKAVCGDHGRTVR